VKDKTVCFRVCGGTCWSFPGLGARGDGIDDAVMVDVEGQCPVVKPALLFGGDDLAENERVPGAGNGKEKKAGNKTDGSAVD
jgi:hypothetical protein